MKCKHNWIFDNVTNVIFMVENIKTNKKVMLFHCSKCNEKKKEILK